MWHHYGLYCSHLQSLFNHICIWTTSYWMNTHYQFFSPCCSTSGVDHLIELRTRTGPSFLVFLRSPLEVTFSYFVSLDFETVQQCYTIARLFPASSFWALSFFSSIAEHTLFWFESMKIRVWVGKIFPPAEIWTADLLHRKPMLWPLCYGAPPITNKIIKMHVI